MQSLTWQDSLRQLLRENVRQYTMIAALLLIGLGFAVLTDGVFISTRNLSNLLVQTASTSILAMGMVLIIVTGNIDLSVGSTMGFCGALAAMSLIRAEWSVFPVVLVTLAAGMLIGAWHGYWVAFRRVPAFIVTLA
ncbi:MAG: sugar ABC transporter permease, partial [Proteobacteria bacterium]|nr:sugar ABC transporter permease [Pseudomonadota bacterium]